jgi:biotin operon repressor
MNDQKLIDRLKFIKQDLEILVETLQIQGVDMNSVNENGQSVTKLLQNIEDAADLNKSYVDSWEHYAVKYGRK